MKMVTYEVNAKDSSLATTSSLVAARAFVAHLRVGHDPSVTTSVDRGHGVSIRRVYDWENNVTKMQKLIAASAK